MQSNATLFTQIPKVDSSMFDKINLPGFVAVVQEDDICMQQLLVIERDLSALTLDVDESKLKKAPFSNRIQFTQLKELKSKPKPQGKGGNRNIDNIGSLPQNSKVPQFVHSTHLVNLFRYLALEKDKHWIQEIFLTTDISSTINKIGGKVTLYFDGQDNISGVEIGILIDFLFREKQVKNATKKSVLDFFSLFFDSRQGNFTDAKNHMKKYDPNYPNNSKLVSFYRKFCDGKQIASKL